MTRRPTHVYESLVAMALAGILASWASGTLLPGGIGLGLMVTGWWWPAWALVLDTAWMGLALGMGKVSQTVLLGLIYFLVLTPIGLLGRLFRRRDPLLLSKPAKTTFQSPGEHKATPNFQFPW